MFSAVACAEPGSGKSWLTISLAETLDRTVSDKSRFDMSRVYFSAAEFAEGMAKKWPKGSVHIFDDAGLNLFSREAMQKNVRDIAKIFQSIRYKNYIIFLSLPAFTMLDKVVRQLVTAYIQPVGIDYANGMTECKFHWLSTNPHKGNVYRHRPERLEKVMHPMLNYLRYKRTLIDTIWVQRPSVEITRLYEAKKKAFMDEYFKRVSRDISKRASGQKESETIYRKYYELVKGDLEEFLVDKKGEKVVDYRAILAKYPECGMGTTNTIARVLNFELSNKKSK